VDRYAAALTGEQHGTLSCTDKFLIAHGMKRGLFD
jgi:hypothetical protein